MISHVVLNSCFLDTVFVILPCTAAETAISKVRKLLHIDGPPPPPPPPPLNGVVLAVAEGLFGLYVPERTDKLFMSFPPPHLP